MTEDVKKEESGPELIIDPQAELAPQLTAYSDELIKLERQKKNAIEIEKIKKEKEEREAAGLPPVDLKLPFKKV